ncbi:GatB/YqeY domain-containing protein [Bacillus stercoris]|nr:GatB/YqeY domain-containing protein [Bacillus stercoris]
MSLLEQIKKDRTQAMKEKDSVKLGMLRMLLSTFDTERGKTGSDLSEERILELITRNRNNLNEEIKSLEDADRDSSLQKQQLEVVLSYLPKQLSEDEIREIVESSSKEVKESGGNFGQLMGVLSGKLKGKADMKFVSKTAKEMF